MKKAVASAAAKSMKQKGAETHKIIKEIKEGGKHNENTILDSRR